ncbi:hypothetical protein [Crateriforma spongiae]|uniref:hypothetical protein n=1 Tax=Crateriforma spongiae TaxID=2724528 RepID=UPI0014470BEC|nr:hypothetical protein [Crateriforma spongiae]
MHCLQLANLASLLAQRGHAIAYREDAICPRALTDYWVACRSRSDLWHQAMARNRQTHQAGDWVALRRWWDDHLVVLQEILVSEMLSRVVACLAAASDQQFRSAPICSKTWSDEDAIDGPLPDADDWAIDPWGEIVVGGDSVSGYSMSHDKDRDASSSGDASTTSSKDSTAAGSGKQDLSPITDAIQSSHLDARNRVQFLMLHNRGCRVTDAVRLNRLRMTVERWTDALLGRMPVRLSTAMKYGFDKELIRSYADETAELGPTIGYSAAAALLNASMMNTLSRHVDRTPALPQANRRVAQSVIKMLRPNLFDDWGELKSLRQHRIECDHRHSELDGKTPTAWHMDGDDSGDRGDAGAKDSLQRWYLA